MRSNGCNIIQLHPSERQKQVYKILFSNIYVGLERKIRPVICCGDRIKRGSVACHWCSSLSRLLCGRSSLNRLLCSSINYTLLHFPCTYRSVPATVEFATFYVKRHSYDVVNIALVVFYSVFSENFKIYFARILLLCFKYIGLHFPGIA